MPRPAVTTHPTLHDIAVLAGAEEPSGPETAVTGVTLDSRRVRPGDLYAALPGARTHGAAFGAQARDAGAVAVLTDPAGAARLGADGVDLPCVVVPDPRAVLGPVSARVWGTDLLRAGGSARPLTVVGLTGTNGKTTTAYLLVGALEALHRRTGLVGTVETRIGDERVASVRTTPEAPDLHALLALMAQRQVDTCVMEVSSHALALHRVDGVVFDVAVFTNLSQDHLDFHETMEAYYRAKADLFTARRSRRGVVCIDDEWGRRLAGESLVPVTTVGSDEAHRPDWLVTRHPNDPAAFTLTGIGEFGAPLTLDLRSSLTGGFNVVNTALAAVALRLLGVPDDDVGRAILRPPQVPGRMERVTRERPGSDDPLAVVDYAHTPDAIAAALQALRAEVGAGGVLVCVTGAGGDRDRDKRAAMGRAAAHADVVVVTDDNPRSEEPATIRAAVLAGARAGAGDGGAAEVVEVGDRHGAILEAVRRAAAAGPGSVLAVVGKGHESGQEVAGVVHPFDDRVELARALETVLGGTP